MSEGAQPETGHGGTTTASAVTLQRHAAERIGGDLAVLLGQLSFAARIVARETRRAPLVGRLGTAGSENPTGDPQKELDVYANRVFLEAFEASRLVAGIVSEELEEVHAVTCPEPAPYLLAIDPIDGSSNIDSGAAVGSIFALFQRAAGGREPCEDPEAEMLGGPPIALAGYVLYGPATILVYSDGERVDGFTLDPSVGELILSHPDLRCPERGAYYAVNSGNAPRWEPGARKFFEALARDEDGHAAYSLRYTGGMVTDVHRMLLEGGIYCYPADEDNPSGKIRLLYEAAPLAFVAEAAGGAGSTGRGRLLDVEPQSIHQAVPVAIGSRHEVAEYQRTIQQTTQEAER